MNAISRLTMRYEFPEPNKDALLGLLVLPVLAMVIGGFATLTMLTKNAFLDEIRKQYVVTARAKDLGGIRWLIPKLISGSAIEILLRFRQSVFEQNRRRRHGYRTL